MKKVKLDKGPVQGDSVAGILDLAMDAGGDSAMDAGAELLRLTPVLHPARRIKHLPYDHYRFGDNRSRIGERWFGSETKQPNRHSLR